MARAMTGGVSDVLRGARALACALAVTLLGGATLGCSGASPGSGGSAAPTAPTASGRPPDFELPALDGSSVRLSEHLGRDVVLLDFWATFCEPCLRAMPHLNALYERHKTRGFVVLGVSIDSADSLPEVRTEVQKLGIRFPILLDQETRVVALYNPKVSAPFSVLIDRSGQIRVKREGYTTASGSAIERDIESALD